MPKTSIFIIVFITATLCFGTTNAQRLKDHNNIGWYNIFGSIGLLPKTTLLVEYQRRSDDIIMRWQQSLARGAMQYRFKNGLMAAVGYGFIVTYPYGDYPAGPYHVPEHRIHEQLIWGDNIGRMSLNHRLRLEQRFVGKINQTAPEYTRTDWVYLNRIRYQLRAQMPLNKKTMEDKTWYAATFDEVFIGFGKNVNQNVFDQNRIGLLFGYQYNKMLRAEVGYLNQTLQQAALVGGKQVYQYNNGLILNVFVTK